MNEYIFTRKNIKICLFNKLVCSFNFLPCRCYIPKH